MTQVTSRVTIPASVQPGATAGPPAPEAGTTRHYLTGTPGRMRLLAGLCALLSFAFGILGYVGLRAVDGAVDRASANTEQVVRVQNIYADLLQADATTTNGFLLGGLETTESRDTYDAAIARVTRAIAQAGTAQPADGEALATLNERVENYISHTDQARAYNRQALPVGAQYLTLASAELRADVLPVVAAIADANQQRADEELAGSAPGWFVVALGLLTLLLLGYTAVWLASRTRRYVNLPLAGALLLIGGVLVLSLQTVFSTTSTMSDVADGDFRRAVAMAQARAAAYDAKSNESLTLVRRGSGTRFEAAYVSAQTRTLDLLEGTSAAETRNAFVAYTTVHKKVRALDDDGDWDEAVDLATTSDPGGANPAFNTFNAKAQPELDRLVKSVVSDLDGLNRPGTAWAVGLAGLLAGILSLRSMSKRIEEYR